MKIKKNKINLDKEMIERIQRMALRTWDTIAYDLFEGIKAAEGIEYPTMRRNEVVEVVCDASYMLTHGGDKEAYEAWDKLPSYKQKTDIVKEVFTSTRYGI